MSNSAAGQGPSKTPRAARVVGRPERPTGWKRLAFRAPIHLYRLGLGGIFGRRLLLLEHLGRTSGKTRRVVLEVVAYDRQARTWTLASGFGPGAQWYRNLQEQPRATIQVGRRRCAVIAQFLPAEEGGRIMARYAAKNPKAAKALTAYMRIEVDGTAEGYRQAGENIPFVRLVEQ
ncbi:nitroreductase family deazaflavin-dependent oxidoreductase [Streptomyces rimosus]|uniref:nitroreductase family deazaflavin-dependent oxidoreductase n=1 Tax=Streptomyces rimosus TaxID=1927 RepID=UPI001F35B9CD|nr:nitroreductase family deazaflavin-dependent oxidoreductase [Streptomyces rimosus]